MNGNPLRWIEGMQWHRYDYIYDTKENRYGEIRFCTFFLNMLENQTFRRRFIDALSLMAGSVFAPLRVDEILEELGDRVRPTMSWEGASPDGSLNEIRNNMNGRADRWVKYMKDYAPLRLSQATTCQLSLDCNNPDGLVFLNGQLVPYGQFQGTVFTPSTLSVKEPAGYKFKGWATSRNPGWYLSHNQQYQLTSQQESMTIVACFEPVATECPVVINEVSASNDIYVNDYFKRNDWVELFNVSPDTVDIAGMYLSDDASMPDKYAIAPGDHKAGTLIAPGGHLVIWCDKLEPLTQLHAPFKLSAGGGIVSIMASDQSWKNTLAYDMHSATETVGRYPDGSNEVYTMNIPTIGRRNLHTSYLTPVDQSVVTDISLAANVQSDLTLSYAADHLIVKSRQAASARLVIYALSGQQLCSAEMQLHGGRAEADCSHLPAGCYISKVTDTSGHTATCKFAIDQ